MELITNIMKYNYLRKKHLGQTALYRLHLFIELKYNARRFRHLRLYIQFKIYFRQCKKQEIDIDGILGSVRFNVDNVTTPLKKKLEECNKDRIEVNTVFLT